MHRKFVKSSWRRVCALLLLPGTGWLALGGCPPPGGNGGGGQTLVFARVVVDSAANAAWSTYDGPAATAVADIDGDGRLDLVSAWKTVGAVRLHQQQRSADGTITWNNVTLVSGSLASGVQALAVHDIDRDGRLDLVAASGQGRILYLRQIGADSANPANWDISVISASQRVGFDSWSDVQLADVDGDGQLEVIATLDSPGGRVCIFDPPARPASGDGWARVDVAVNGRNGAARVIPIDMDGNGSVDLLTIARGEGSDSVAWYANPGPALALTNAWARHSIGHVDDPRGMALAYIDGDGFLDILVSSGNGHGLWGFQAPAVLSDLLDTSKHWTQHPITDFGTDKGSGVSAADLDGDGLTEIVAGTSGTGQLSLYKWSPALQDWVRKGIDAAPGNYGPVLIADIDQDGKYDVVTTLDGATGQVVWYPQQ